MKLLPILMTAITLHFAAAYADEPGAPDPGAQLLGSGNTSFSDDSSTSTARPPDSPADATLTLRGNTLAAGIGYVWGDGTMSFRGAAHKFKIKGVTVADVGASHITSDGIVMHLNKLSDFAGNYVALTANLTVGGGGSAVYMKNEHGVVIKLHSTTTGLRFALSSDGVTVKLES